MNTDKHKIIKCTKNTVLLQEIRDMCRYIRFDLQADNEEVERIASIANALIKKGMDEMDTYHQTKEGKSESS